MTIYFDDRLDEVPKALATIGAATAGIADADDPPPASIDSMQLPFLYVLTRDGDFNWNLAGTYMGQETRQYAVQVAVIGTSHGFPKDREELCRPLITKLVRQYMANPHLGVDGVQEVIVRRATGPVILPEYGGKFIGFELTVEVQMTFARDFANGE